MGKKILLAVLGVLLVALSFFAAFPDQILDLLPIDQSGWREENGILTYHSEKGDPLSGWQTIDGQTYYLTESGPLSGWQELDGGKYHFSPEGHLQTGWIEDEGTEYYLDENGRLYSGWLETDLGKQYLLPDGTLASGWVDTEEGRFYLTEQGTITTGWADTGEGRFYLLEDGSIATGWQEVDGQRMYFTETGAIATGRTETGEGVFFLTENGTIQTGWVEYEGQSYYLLEDGTPAQGRVIIDGKTHYFTSTGAEVLLVNPWNYLPEDYEVELITLDSGHKAAAECHDALLQLLEACRAAGHIPYLCSSYRTQSHQQRLFNNMLAEYNGNWAKASQIVAVPGTSEHQLGLAFDITDNSYRKLNYQQEDTATQKWLMEHSWEYGFILRYPSDRKEITGIIYEPWHYRWVGLELARELHDLDLCLEEYLDQLTGDGSTCGNPDLAPGT